MKLRLIQVVIVLFVVQALLPVARVQAAVRDASIKVEVGYQNYFDPRTWVPVRITVSAAQTQPLGGVISFAASQSDRPFEGRFAWVVSKSAAITPRIQAATLTIGLPGRFITNGGELVWQENGQTIARTHLPGIAISGSEIAGVISERPEAVQFLAGVSSSNNSTELVTAYIPPPAIPASMSLLASINYLYVDGAAAALLSPAQVSSIRDWTRAGGILILGGIQPNAGQVGGFLGQSPVIPRVVLDRPPDLLANYANSAGIHSNESLLFGALAPGAQALVGSANFTLVGARAFGRGEIVYAGFDAAAPDFVSWSGNAEFWDTLLHSLRAEVLSAKSNLFGSDGLWTLYTAAEQFPQLHSPPLWIWESVFGVYVFTVGPLLYFILRRRRKNELAWGYLPLISVLLAAAIYVLGVLQQPIGILTQSVGVVDLFDPALAQITGVEAMMSPQTRSYAIRTPVGTWSATMTDQAANSANEKNSSEISNQFGKITFNRVNAWTGRFVLSSMTTRKFGYVNAVLYNEGNTLAGYLTNDTALDLLNAAFVYQRQVVTLGTLKKGQSINVSVVLKNGPTHVNPLTVLGDVSPNAAHGVGKSLFENVGDFLSHPLPDNEALFVAWSHEEPPIFTPVGPVLPATPEWLVRELVPVTQIKG